MPKCARLILEEDTSAAWASKKVRAIVGTNNSLRFLKDVAELPTAVRRATVIPDDAFAAWIAIDIIPSTDLELEDLELGEVVPLLLQELFLVPVLVPLYQVLHERERQNPHGGRGSRSTQYRSSLRATICRRLPLPPRRQLPPHPPRAKRMLTHDVRQEETGLRESPVAECKEGADRPGPTGSRHGAKNIRRSPKARTKKSGGDKRSDASI